MGVSYSSPLAAGKKKVRGEKDIAVVPEGLKENIIED